MFGIEQFLLQIVPTDLVGSIDTLIVSLTGLIGAVSAIIIAIINQRSQGRNKTDFEHKILHAAEFTQLGAQKTKENIGEISAFMRAVYDSLPPEQKAEAEKRIKPLIDIGSERITTTEQQIALFAKIFGINVDSNPDVPRESAATLRKINSAVLRGKLTDVSDNED